MFFVLGVCIFVGIWFWWFIGLCFIVEGRLMVVEVGVWGEKLILLCFLFSRLLDYVFWEWEDGGLLFFLCIFSLFLRLVCDFILLWFWCFVEFLFMFKFVYFLILKG